MVFFVRLLRATFSIVVLMFSCDWTLAQPLTVVGATKEFNSAYLRLKITAFSGLKGVAGDIRGISPSGENLTVISSDGTIFELTKSLLLNRLDIPPLDLGAKDFLSNNSYKYLETIPRSHAVVRFGDVVYVTYDYFNQKSGRVRFRLAALHPGATQWRIVFESDDIDARYYAIGAGGRMAISGDNLYFTVGDYSLDRRNFQPSDFAASNENSKFGKVFQLDTKTESVSKFSSGHRSPLGIAAFNDRVVITDNGPRGGDGVYILSKGDSCGWPFVSFGTKYSNYSAFYDGSDINGQVYKSPLKGPDFAFVPSVAPTQIIQVKSFNAKWFDDWLVGSLKAMQLFRLHRESDRFVYAEPIPIGHRVRDVAEWNNEIWLVADSGYLLKLTVAQDQELYAGVPEVIKGCMGCHSIDRDVNSPGSYGPNLFGVLGRQIASTGYANYSESLRNSAALGKWTKESLFAFLRSPQIFAPGSNMPGMSPAVSDRDINQIIDALSGLR